MEIEFDPEKAALNLRKHRVSFSHAEQALRDPLGITIEDPDAEGEARFITLGADSLGRILITARGRVGPMQPSESTEKRLLFCRSSALSGTIFGLKPTG